MSAPTKWRARSAGELSEAQRQTIGQLEREERCGADRIDVFVDCGWAVISDTERHVTATIDRSGTVLSLEGDGREVLQSTAHQAPRR